MVPPWNFGNTAMASSRSAGRFHDIGVGCTHHTWNQAMGTMAAITSAVAAETPRVRPSHTTPSPSAITTAAEPRCQATSCGSAEKVRTHSASTSTRAAMIRLLRSRRVAKRPSSTHTSTSSPSASIGSTRAGQRSGPTVPGPAVHISAISANSAMATSCFQCFCAAFQSTNASAGIRNQAM